jgi:hypothetical protein
LTSYGKKLLSKIEPLYAKEVKRIMGVLLEDNQKKLIQMLEKIRTNIPERV